MIGPQVHQYRIIEKIGAGGMGEVYLAMDTNLNRHVALKFLSPAYSAEKEFIARFRHEAKAAAKLNHPNIVTIYDLAEFDGRLYISMENVTGRTVADLIRAGPLSLAEVLDYGIQIVEGLSAAHNAGIVHRDIKPSNVMVNSHGRAMILDFGLARMSGATRVTKSGSTLGTTHYKSPEQVRGADVGSRSDIFSFGTMLYEMVTGVPPFSGDYEAAVIYAIVNEDPKPPSVHTGAVTEGLQNILFRVLKKNPSERYQDCEEMLADLRKEKESLSTPSRIAQSYSGLSFKAVVIAAAILVTTSIVTIMMLRDSDTPERLLPTSTRQITFDGDVYDCDLSPDGRYIAYIRGTYFKSPSAPPMRLFVANLEKGNPRVIFEDRKISCVRWSPDGTELLIRADNDSSGGVYVVPQLGGSPRRFTLLSASSAWRLSWSPDGTQFAAVTDSRSHEIFVVSRSSGEVDVLPFPGEYEFIHDIHWSSTNNYLLIETEGIKGNRLWTYGVESHEKHEVALGEMTSAILAPDGRSIYYLKSSQRFSELNHQLLDVSTGKAAGDPKTLVRNIESGGPIAISQDKTKLIYIRDFVWSNLWHTSLDSSSDSRTWKSSQITRGTSLAQSPVFSPNGKSIACSMPVGGENHIFVVDAATGEKRQITHTGGNNYLPAWSPDGREIAYITVEKGQGRIAVISALGGVPRFYDVPSVNPKALFKPLVWSPGREILYQRIGNTKYDRLDPKTGEIGILGPDYNKGYMFHPSYSPKGDKVAVLWVLRNEVVKGSSDTASHVSTGRTGIWSISVTENETRRLYDRSLPLGWSPNEDLLYFWLFKNRPVVSISMITGDVDTLFELPFDNVYWVHMNSTANDFVYPKVEAKSDIWVMEGFESNFR